MNISLSWADYALITGVCLIGYYLIVAVTYYRKELSNPFHPKGNKGSSMARSQSTPESENVSAHNLNTADEQLLEEVFSGNEEQLYTPSTVQDFVDEIDAYTQNCGYAIDKEEFKKNIRKILHKYPALISSSLQYILSELIKTASQNNCSIHWSEDELNELWNG
jgi:hypothetical protein